MDGGNNEMPCSIYVTDDVHTKSKWDELVQELGRNRFFINKDLEIFKYFIDGMKPIEIKAGDIFYRARKGEYCEIEDLTAPPVYKCNAGRLNPKGIRYLYVANSKRTAISEVRPWIDSKVTIAELSTKRNLRILDFKCDDDNRGPNNYKKVIDENFSKPMSLEDSDKGYLITQAIAEYIKNKGYDGVKYSSSVHRDGYNIVIFEPDNMEGVDIIAKVVVTGIEYSYEYQYQ